MSNPKKAQDLLRDLVSNHHHSFDNAASLVLAQAIFELGESIRGMNVNLHTHLPNYNPYEHIDRHTIYCQDNYTYPQAPVSPEHKP